MPNVDHYTLNVWQKRQAALLYHFASLDYLKGLKRLIDAMIQGADILLDTAQSQGRDALIVDERWGARDTSGNWGTYGFPALKDFQQATAKDIAERAHEVYSFTGANQCARLLGELSMRWATEEEEERFQNSVEFITKYAFYIDYVMERPQGLNDGIFNNIWHGVESDFPSLRTPRHAALFPLLPKFHVRTDVEAVTGKPVPRTGVYVPQDDVYGSPQFGWTGGVCDGSLDEGRTFNDLGLEAARVVGRDNLWNDSPDLLGFIKRAYSHEFEAFLRESRGGRFAPEMLDDASWAPAFLSSACFTTRPCKWYFVEIVPGEFEEPTDEKDTEAVAVIQRVPAEQRCPKAGWWSTPSKQSSRRYFNLDEVFPAVEGSSYGATFWLWDTDQR